MRDGRGAGMAKCREEKTATTWEKLRPWEEKKRKIKTKMKGRCKDRPGVERADGVRRDRPKQVTTTRTLQANLAKTGTVKDLTTPRNIFHDLSANRDIICDKMAQQY